MTIISKTASGDSVLSISPTVLSYKLSFEDDYIGVLNWVNGAFLASFQIESKQYEISFFQNQYLLFESSNSIHPSNFQCNTMEALSDSIVKKNVSQQQSSVCIEFAVEIDNYTRETFASDLQAINWATAIFAGVSQIYEAQTSASLIIVDFIIWNTNDPYESLNSTDAV